MNIETIIKMVITFPILLFVPGYLLYNILSKESDRLELDFEIIFLQILGSILISGWIGLILAEIGYFSLFNLMILLLIICGLLILKYGTKFSLKHDRSLRYGDIYIIILIIIETIFLFVFHPEEFIFGGADPGVYVNTGVNIANTGSILIYDNLLKNSFQYHQDFYNSFREFPGFYIMDKINGIISPQFFHLYPTWIAIFYSIFGLKNGLFVTPLFGFLGVLSIYYTGKTIFNRDIGFIAALILMTNILQIWFSQYPASEMLTQFLFFSGIYTLAKNKSMQDRYLWFISALSFGELFLTRIDTVFVIFVIFAFMGYNYVTENLNKNIWFFIIPFLVLLSQALIHTLSISKIYASDVFYYSSINNSYIILLSISILILIFFIMSQKIFIRHCIEKVFLIQNYFKIFLIIMIVILSIYAYAIRPYTDDPQKIVAYGNLVRTYNEENFIRLGWYLSDPVILLAIIGCILIISKEWNNRTSFLLLTGIIFSIFYIYNNKITPHQIYAMRRYIPVVIPSFMLWTSYSIYQICRKTKFDKLFSIIIVCPIIISYLFSNTLILNHTEYFGAIDQTDLFAKIFPENSIVIFTGNSGPFIATPLRYIYNIDSLVLDKSYNRTALDDIILGWISDNKNVYIIQNDENMNTGISKKFKFVYIAKGTISTPILERVYDSRPSKIIMANTSYWIYKIEKSDSKDKIQFLDIGYNDYGLIEGFHNAEQNDITYRWTSKYSRVLLYTDAIKNNNISIKMGAARPSILSPKTNIVFYADGKYIANMFIGNDMDTYFISIPYELLKNKDDTILTIETINTWKPSKVLNSTDSRELGIMIDWIKVNTVDQNITD